MLKNNRNWVIITLISLVLVFIAGVLKKRAEVSISVYLGIFFLLLTLVPSNLALLLPEAPKKALLKLGKYKRDFGISAGLLFLTHALLAWNIFGKLKLEFLVRGEIILGFISLLIFIALLATSSKWSIRVLKKNWKRLHILVWAAIPLAFFHSSLAGVYFKNEMSVIAVLGFGSLYLLAFAQLFIKKWQHFTLILVAWISSVVLISVLYPNTFSDFNKSLNEMNKPTSTNTSTTTSSSIEIPQKTEPATPTTNSSTPNEPRTSTKAITNSQLASNNSATNCWVSFDKKVYNVTNYLNAHPGGRRELLRVCGKTIDNLSSSHAGGSFSSSEIQGILKDFYVGDLG